MSKEFKVAVALMIAAYGEGFVREYLRTYCEVVLDDPQTDDYTRTKMFSVLRFLNENAIIN